MSLATAPSARTRPLLLLLLTTACLLAAGCASPPQSARMSSAGAPLLSPEQANDIAIHAMGLVGTPYRYGGNTPEGGFDCSGLIGYVLRQSAGPTAPRTVARLAGFGRPVPVAEMRSGDLVLFGASTPTHAGIYVGEGRFVHAPSTGGEVRLDRLDGVYWSRQPTQARRL